MYGLGQFNTLLWSMQFLINDTLRINNGEIQ